MTIRQLIERLEVLPPDAVATYFHNTHGVINIEEIEHREVCTPQGREYDIVVISGAQEKE